jgi:hypothetical protein
VKEFAKGLWAIWRYGAVIPITWTYIITGQIRTNGASQRIGVGIDFNRNRPNSDKIENIIKYAVDVTNDAPWVATGIGLPFSVVANLNAGYVVCIWWQVSNLGANQNIMVRALFTLHT